MANARKEVALVAIVMTQVIGEADHDFSTADEAMDFVADSAVKFYQRFQQVKDWDMKAKSYKPTSQAYRGTKITRLYRHRL